ncbi:hypothetical protein ACSBR1_002310 [Camellia fascicularis]
MKRAREREREDEGDEAGRGGDSRHRRFRDRRRHCFNDLAPANEAGDLFLPPELLQLSPSYRSREFPLRRCGSYNHRHCSCCLLA